MCLPCAHINISADDELSVCLVKCRSWNETLPAPPPPPAEEKLPGLLMPHENELISMPFLLNVEPEGAVSSVRKSPVPAPPAAAGDAVSANAAPSVASAMLARENNF